MKKRRKEVIDFILYYNLTEKLLKQFQLISPDLYNEINNIRDHRGRPVDVYVKFVSIDGTSIKAAGTTYIDQSENDEDLYRSEYGEGKVSVKIWMINRALFVLAHELGHVKYQVENLADYVKYYKNNYIEQSNPSQCLGHNAHDLSGKTATIYEKKFRSSYLEFQKTTTEKLPGPADLLTKMSRDSSDVLRLIGLQDSTVFRPVTSL